MSGSSYGSNEDNSTGPDRTYTTYPDPRPRPRHSNTVDTCPSLSDVLSTTGGSSLGAPVPAPAPASAPPALSAFGSAHQISPPLSFDSLPPHAYPASPPFPAKHISNYVNIRPSTAYVPGHQSPFAASSPPGFPSGASALPPLHQQSLPAPHNPPQPPNLVPASPVPSNPPQGVNPGHNAGQSAPPVPALGLANIQASAAPIPASQPATVQAPVAPPMPALAPIPRRSRPVVPSPPVPVKKRNAEKTAEIFSVISYEPPNVLAATATVNLMDETRLLNAIESVYYRNIGQAPRSSAKANVNDDAQRRINGFGILAILPNELLMETINYLPLNDLTRIMSVNKTIRWLVQTSASFKHLTEGAPNATATVLMSEMGKHLTIGELPRLMTRRDCEICNSRFAAFLFLPTLTRCCFICLRTDEDFEVTTITGASRMRLVSRTALLRRVPSVQTIPGNYGLSQISYVQHLHLVSVKQIAALFDRRPNAPERIDDLIPGMRMLAAVALPYFNSVTGNFERGVICKACELAKVPGRNSTWLLSNEGMMGHFEGCSHAKRMWKRDLEKRGVDTEDGA